jgi:hypothetical protein
MNQLPVNPIDRNAVDRTVRRRRESARADLSLAARPRDGRAVMLLDNRRRLGRIRLGGPLATRQLKEFSNERRPE